MSHRRVVRRGRRVFCALLRAEVCEERPELRHRDGPVLSIAAEQILQDQSRRELRLTPDLSQGPTQHAEGEEKGKGQGQLGAAIG